jgi:hypothetical protein
MAAAGVGAAVRLRAGGVGAPVRSQCELGIAAAFIGERAATRGRSATKGGDGRAWEKSLGARLANLPDDKMLMQGA